ncbi:hypothetical protein V8J88_00885 [Massilia sp. W12]|uniref:hypothetical protein n=1 Tax=Massilia sp. W12 TaxID=3126507 RepID=UPI0030CFF4F2
MTGLENQREFGNKHFAISEQSLRHLVAAVVLLALSLLATEFFSVWFLYIIIGIAALTMVAAFLVDIHHREKWQVDEDQ